MIELPAWFNGDLVTALVRDYSPLFWAFLVAGWLAGVFRSLGRSRRSR